MQRLKVKEVLKPSASNGAFCILFVAVDKKYAAGGTVPTKEKHPSERKRKPAKRERIPTTSVRTGLGMTGCKECGDSGRCGERTERCRWQRKRSERVAAVKISSVRRKAAQKFWAPQQGHRPLRKRYKECDAVRNPPVTASPCQPPLGKGAEGTGDADCHDQFANWSRNDMAFYRGCRARPVREDRGVRPYGGVTRDAGKESPSHGFAVPALFRQGAIKDEGCGLPHQ